MSKSERNQRNVIIVYADDLGFGDLSCYGSHQISTPNLDRLCAEALNLRMHMLHQLYVRLPVIVS